MRLLPLVLLIAAPAAAQSPAPADSAPSDSVFTIYLDDLRARTDEDFALQELSISDAEVDSLLRIWEETGQEPPRGDFGPTGDPRWRFDWELAALRYNRVEGFNVVPSAELSFPTRRPLRIFAQVGYGWASEEVTGRAGIRARLAEGAGQPTLELEGARDVYAYGSGGIPGNTLNALLLGEDWDDYYLGEGAAAALSFTPGRGMLEIRYRTEDAQSMDNVTDAPFGHGPFRPNPPIDDGRSRSLDLTLAWNDEERDRFAATARGRVAGRGLGGDFDYESWRLDAVARKTLWFGDLAAVRLSGGAATGAVPWQGLHLLGGFDTLRGYDVNELPARRFAHGRIDYRLGTDLLRWIPFVGRLRLQPTPFFDGAAVFEAQNRDGTPVRFDEPELRSSAGVEIRQNVLGIPGGGGQFRLDIAKRLDRGEGAWTFRFGFTAGR